jgi:hypothetical protein
MSVYSALTRRNRLALAAHLLSSSSGNPISLVVNLCRGGDATASRVRLAQLSEQLQDLYESHHNYPVLHYFQLRHQYYALPQMVGLLAESATLIRTLLNCHDYGDIADSAEVREMLETCNHLLDNLGRGFLPKHRYRYGLEFREDEADARERLAEARQALGAQGIHVQELEDEALRRYIEERRRWVGLVCAFRDYMGWPDAAGV